MKTDRPSNLRVKKEERSVGRQRTNIEHHEEGIAIERRVEYACEYRCVCLWVAKRAHFCRVQFLFAQNDLFGEPFRSWQPQSVCFPIEPSIANELPS
jgi:hypothetical protein